VKKILIKAVFELASPLCVSSGNEGNTDKDVIKDFNGDVFIPGTSIAGALRQYLTESEHKKVFGYTEKLDTGETVSVESALTVYDAEIKNPPQIGLRDGIALDDFKITIPKKKFDYEIIETGAQVTFRFQFKQQDSDPDLTKYLKRLILAIERGDIRFGSKKNRGLGRLKLTKSDDGKFEIYKSEFTKENIRKYFEFDWEKMDKWELGTNDGQADKPKYKKMTIPLKLSGGISVRTYSAKPDAPDYTHIKCNGQPVIPGSTWNGAIRHRTKEILFELGVSACKTESLLDDIFGAKSGDPNASASKIVFSESIIEGGVDVPMTRNKIDRFDGSTMDGALYSEVSHFGGTCDLEIMLIDDESTKWVWGLMVLVIKDIQHGFLSVGGQTAVGRGLFTNSDKIQICGETEYIKALNNQLKSLGLGENLIAV